MAAPKAADSLDVLEQMINEVIVQSGKIFKENSRNGKKSTAIASAQRINQANAKFNAALGDLEVDIIRAKSVLLRDLAQIQAKNQPAPGLQSMPQAPPAPMTIDLESPKRHHAAVAPQAASKPAKVEVKQAAPFPNMGIEPRTGPSPKLGFKGKPSPSPQPMSRIGSQGAKAPVKAGSPAMKTGSPAMAKSVSPAMTKVASPAVAKTASPAVMKATPALGGKAGSPALKGASPVVKAGSPAVKTASPVVTSKPTPKATPSPAMPKTTPVPPPATAPAPTPIMNPNPAPTPTMTIPATATGADPVPQAINTDNSFSNFFDLTSPTAPTAPTAPVAANSGLNFTDMQFSLAPAAGDGRPQVPSADDDFDIEAYAADVAQNLLADDSFGVGGTGDGAGQASNPAMDITMGGTVPAANNGPPKADGKAEPQMDDLFDLNGTSIDMDLDLSGEGADGTTNFEELFFDTGDDAMEEFDDAYFGLQ